MASEACLASEAAPRKLSDSLASTCTRDSLVAPQKTLRAASSLAIAMITFSCVAGGPFGIEVAVQCAGALATVFGLCIAGITWGLPQALITAELAAALPSNGGPVHWVTRAFGRRWGFINGLLLILQQATDICVYPTLIASYAGSAWGAGASPWALYGIKVASMLIAAAFNIVGIDALSASATFLTAAIMLPFVMLPIAAAATGASFDWAALGPSGTPAGWHSQLAVFVSTVLWNMQGWSEMGCVAGEVKSAEIVFPRGMAVAAGLVTFAYAVPVLFGVALQPDTSRWSDGFFFVVAGSVAPWLAYAVLASALLANMSTLQASLAAYSRTLQAVAREGFLPIPLLARNQTRFETPVAAIAVLTISTVVLTAGTSFSQLVVVDSCFYLIAQASVFAAFLRLRFAEPGLPRPYRFPGGRLGAVAAGAICSVLVVCALGLAVASGGAMTAAAVLVAFAVLVLLSFVWTHVPCCARASAAMELAWSEGEEEEGGKGARLTPTGGSDQMDDQSLSESLLLHEKAACGDGDTSSCSANSDESSTGGGAAAPHPSCSRTDAAGGVVALMPQPGPRLAAGGSAGPTFASAAADVELVALPSHVQVSVPTEAVDPSTAASAGRAVISWGRRPSAPLGEDAFFVGIDGDFARRLSAPRKESVVGGWRPRAASMARMLLSRSPAIPVSAAAHTASTAMLQEDAFDLDQS